MKRKLTITVDAELLPRAKQYGGVTPARGVVDTRDFIAELTRFVSVAPADTAALRYALSLPMADFVDAMQVAAA